ncbi:type II toxin-antitoxin system toxin DNA ADP-ribosyl transferase DarT [Thiofilum flexile]|uniref:type II toxin-antitoxin system toxin DNA ADP-ribosyl transferase DarT n=1 Tax=Thiofilum flexile TaxID=125627 RepID=UPI00036A2A87|nr:DUF4433 domain-containing protein [Thiofilum flexile]
MLYEKLNPKNAYIWRIIHRKNLSWVFENGLHSGNSPIRSATWINIGNEELINRRAARKVPLPPGGTLNDYVPFYFTPFSPMMYNIHTGCGGVLPVSNNDIVILVSSLYKVAELGLMFLFTDRHAYLSTANYYRDLDKLSEIDWPRLQQRNFQRDLSDPEKIERYQAEALIYQQAPLKILIGAICYTKQVQEELQQQAIQIGITLDIHCRASWYF